MSFPTCALCGSPRKLEQSHIIPQFVCRWAKGKGTGGEVPSARTRAMLCGRCEDLFSAHESEFARHVFHPAAAGAPLSAKYSGWLRGFAASVCWRILEERVALVGPASFFGRWAGEAASCRAAWQDYLLGRRPDVGPHHLHLLPVAALLAGARRATAGDAPASGTSLMGLVASDVCCTDRAAFVCARLGPFILVGLIADPGPKLWQGTRINAEGKLKPRDVIVPAECWEYLPAR